MAESKSIMIRIYPEAKNKLDEYLKDKRMSITQAVSKFIEEGIDREEKERDIERER